MDNISYNNEDVARLFREHDDIGSDSSLWLRPLLKLLRNGKPIGKFVVLMVSPMNQQKLPFGMLTQTENNRIIFWPILPPNVNMICAGETIKVFDHITLEFPSEKIHMTAYDTKNQPIHVARAWRTHHFSDYNLSLWFTLLVRISILHQQDKAVQRLVKMPKNDKDRRTKEFVRFAKNISLFNVPLPPREPEGDYIYLGFYLALDSIKINQLSPSILPVGASMDSQIEGWPVGKIFQIALSRFTFCQRTICVATTCPPGRIRSDIFVGFPRRT